jgi:hypothetical protein
MTTEQQEGSVMTGTQPRVAVVTGGSGGMLLSPLAELDLADFDRMHRWPIRPPSTPRSGGSSRKPAASTSSCTTPGT